MDEGLIAFIAALLVLFAVFKLFGWSIKLFFKLLINALIGAGIIFIFNIILSGMLGIHTLYIETNWVTALITGILGVPGVIGIIIYGLAI